MQFQFHKGTIKTDKLYRLMSSAKEFQFHKGTIKTTHQHDSKIIPTISIP